MLFKAVCCIVSARLVGRGFRFPIDSKLQTWNLADHQASPPLCFSPAASAQAPPMLLLLVWCYFRPPCPLFLLLLLLFLPYLPSHSWCPGTLACMHALILSVSLHSPHLWLFPNIKQKQISFIYLISGSLAEAHISSPALGLTSAWTKELWRLLLMIFIQKELICICCFISIRVWLFGENEFRKCKLAFMRLFFPHPCFCFLRLTSFIAHLLVAYLEFAAKM